MAWRWLGRPRSRSWAGPSGPTSSLRSGGFARIKGWDLAQKMSEHARKFGATIVTDTVERVRKAEDGWFDVATSRGVLYRAPAVILTAGGTPVKLGVPGEQEYAAKGVSYCA